MSDEFVVASSFQALSALGLSQEQLKALACRGSLQAEGPEKRCFKLRFRHHGRRIVRYVGTDIDLITRVRDELEHLQHGARMNRSSRRLVNAAKSCLRQTKSCLTPALIELGYHFWGNEIRRRRIDKQADCERLNSSRILNKGAQIMDDRNKSHIDSAVSRRPQDAPSKPSAVSARHQERIDDLARSALDCSDPRQAVLRYAMAKSFGMGAVVAENVEHVLRGSPMTIREFRKHVVPMLSTAANLFKQGARCAQIDREFDQMLGQDGEGPPLLPPCESEN